MKKEGILMAYPFQPMDRETLIKLDRTIRDPFERRLELSGPDKTVQDSYPPERIHFYPATKSQEASN